MTEQTSQEGLVEQNTDIDPVEAKALEKGWKPKDEYQGDADKWRSAEVFLALDEPLKRIEHQSKEMKQLRQALEAFKEHHTKVETVAFDRALKSLQAERKQAMIDGDTEKVFELEEAADQVKEQKRALADEARKPVVNEPAQLNPEFVEWQGHNQWYQSNKAMTAAADKYGTELHAEGYTPIQVLRKVEEYIKQEFPHKFENANSKGTSKVEGSSRGGSRSGGGPALTEEQTAIMRKIVKSGVMTEQQYRAELKRMES